MQQKNLEKKHMDVSTSASKESRSDWFEGKRNIDQTSILVCFYIAQCDGEVLTTINWS